MGLEYGKIDFTGLDFGNWNESKWEFVRPGIERVVLAMTAEGSSVTIGKIEEGHETKPHTHPNEQVAIVLQGTCDYYVDGKPVRMKPGSWVVVPPNVEHYIHVFNTLEPVLNLDIFTPNRPEYTEGYKKFLANSK